MCHPDSSYSWCSTGFCISVDGWFVIAWMDTAGCALEGPVSGAQKEWSGIEEACAAPYLSCMVTAMDIQ